MPCYSKLRALASSLTAAEIHRIRTLLYHRTYTSSTCSLNMRDVAKFLLLYYFRLGGMIRFLGGVYTSNFLDFSSIDACLLALSNIPVNPGEPLHNFPTLQSYYTSTPPSNLRSEALEETCYSGTATIIIFPLTPTSPLFTRSQPPTYINPTMLRFPAGDSTQASENSILNAYFFVGNIDLVEELISVKTI